MTVWRSLPGVYAYMVPELSRTMIRFGEMNSAPTTWFGTPLADELVNSACSSRGWEYQTRTVPSLLAVTTLLPSGLNRAALTWAVSPTSSVS